MAQAPRQLEQAGRLQDARFADCQIARLQDANAASQRRRTDVESLPTYMYMYYSRSTVVDLPHIHMI